MQPGISGNRVLMVVYPGTVRRLRTIFIISREVDLRGFGKWGQWAINNRVHVRSTTKKVGVANTQHPLQSHSGKDRCLHLSLMVRLVKIFKPLNDRPAPITKLVMETRLEESLSLTETLKPIITHDSSSRCTSLFRHSFRTKFNFYCFTLPRRRTRHGKMSRPGKG